MAALYGTIGQLDADMRGPDCAALRAAGELREKKLKSGRNDRVRGPETEFAGQATATELLQD
ncbi:hypothetical protein CFAM422_009478 [Trichoderma lentiforme]|uniref:Uncharacterized protein n=1 Tax=Trichoderma lentiforme TaxID=1567552 RepID=A0A9P4X7P9_9HYPO|nr:hypothetical protein CFAM422_009478 [Trichoderma lentiforme]